ncbi:diguanylate cyclase [Eubacteriaceae bacterium ES2]|nr:diguanylate cyclase [Eubacteriaceae bacterium ES2]
MKKLLLLFLILCPILFGPFSTYVGAAYPAQAQDGVLDLTKSDLFSTTIALTGEWDFYWNQLLAPDEIGQGQLSGSFYFPSSWNKYVIDGSKVPGSGAATYHLSFSSPESGVLGITIPKVRTAYNLYINDTLVASAGQLGTSRDSMVPQYLPQIAFFDVLQGENQITLQVSNFYMSSGGLLSPIEIGNASQILRSREKELAFSLFIFGALLIMGFYHLALFFFRKKDLAALYFGLFCVMIALRTSMVGASYFYNLFQSLDFVIVRKFQSLLFYLSPPLVLLFLERVLPVHFHQKIIKLTKALAIIYALAILIIPAQLFSPVNTIFQLYCVFMILYVLTRFIMVLKNSDNSDNLLIIFGGTMFLFTSFLDIVSVSVLSSSPWWPPFLKIIFQNETNSSMGQLIFVLSYSLVLAKKYSDSLAKKTELATELTRINSNLDELVNERTRDLWLSKQKIEEQKLALEKLSLRDPLTGLWNRRQYNESIETEWHRCLRHRHPISLIFIDVDYFKNYNDTYGHLAGDQCLYIIAQIFESTLGRSTDMAFRYGGEEFIILLPEATKEEALKTANMLLFQIEKEAIPHCQSLVKNCVTVSMGVSSMIPSLDTSAAKLIQDADTALYQAKENGRNQVQFGS